MTYEIWVERKHLGASGEWRVGHEPWLPIIIILLA